MAPPVMATGARVQTQDRLGITELSHIHHGSDRLTRFERGSSTKVSQLVSSQTLIIATATIVASASTLTLTAQVS